MVGEIKEMVDLKEKFMLSIRECREEIANLKEKKAIKKSASWIDADGTAKEKEDYVKASVANYDKEISKYEADIELYYNQITVINERIDLEYLCDE